MATRNGASRGVASTLRTAAFDVVEVESTDQASDVMRRNRGLAIVVIDREQLSGDAIRLARWFRNEHGIAVLLLVRSTQLRDLPDLLAELVDDYVVKPFTPAELVTRVDGLVRRRGWRSDDDGVLRVDDVVVDVAARECFRSGQRVTLTETEFRLLTEPVRSHPHVLSKRQLLAAVWGSKAYADNVVERHVCTLRRKLDPGGSELIRTVHGIGYVVRPARALAAAEHSRLRPFDG